MMRLIDADELKKEWTIASPEPYNTDAVEVLESISNAPTVDAVPVVRCNDCQYANPDILLDKYWCTRSLGSMEVEANSFCSYVIKK